MYVYYIDDRYMRRMHGGRIFSFRDRMLLSEHPEKSDFGKEHVRNASTSLHYNISTRNKCI